MKSHILCSCLLAYTLQAPLLRAQTIPNPSFEAQTFANPPGYASGNGGVITGWNINGNVGLNPAGGQNPFANNGPVPDGTKVAFLQSFNNTAQISTTITGLVDGTRYTVSFWVNSRAGYADPSGLWSLNGVARGVLPSGGNGIWQRVVAIFTATGPTADLAVLNFNTPEDTTLLVDDFRITRSDVNVTTIADSGTGSLRQALADAAAAPGPNTITFAPGLAGQTISLDSTIIINDAGGVTIDATGVPGIVINDGLNETYRLFTVLAGSNITIRGLTLANGGGPFYNNGGGAIGNSGTLTLDRCTLSGNGTTGDTADGGAITNNGTVTLTHCTLSNNGTGGVGTGNGGAIASNGMLTLTHCTLSYNFAGGTGGAIYSGVSIVTLNNCIVAGNTNFNAATTENISGTYTGSNNLTSGDPMLAPLADNGGPTKTMALLPGSPALDAGVVLNPVLPFDQRGFTARHVDGNGDGITAPDIGAYEAQGPPAASIGFNFSGGISGNPASAGGSMAAVDVAGVPGFAQANWNNLTNVTDGATHDGSAANAATRMDALGTTLSGLKLWWACPNVWAVYTSPLGSADGKLMNGYLDSNGSGDGSAATDLYASAAAQPFLAVAGLPSALTRGGYRVLVYADGGSTGGVTASYWLNSNDGQNPASAGGERRLTPSVFLSDTANYSDTYIRATGTDVASATAGANYVQFDSQAGSAFTVRAEEHSFRAAINAVQIVPNERIAVTTTVDELDPPGTLGTGVSLREALRDAPDGGGIVFDSALSGQTLELSLSRGDVILVKDVTIDASSLPGGFTITRDSDGDFRLFSVQSGITASFIGLTLKNGKGRGQFISKTGGAIQNAGNLTLRNCTLSGNSTAFDGTNGTGIGGAVYNDGMLTVTGCTFTGNATVRTGLGISTPIIDETSGSGGAIYNSAGKSLTVTNSTFFENTSALDGGAIASRGTVAVTHSTFAGNTASVGGYGGGIAIRGGTLSLAYSIVAGNTAVSAGPDLYRHPTGGGVITPVGTNLIGKNNTVMTEFPEGPPLAPLVGTEASPVVANLSALGKRGNARPTDGDGNGSAVADLGAVERGTFVPPISLAVTTTADEGTGSLRQAITNARGEPGEVITFADGFTGTIVLASEIAIPKTITIDASNVTAGLVLSGGGTNRISHVNSGGNLTLKGVTLTGGNGTGTNANDNGVGGAILNYGTLTLTQCTLSGNSATDGGAISNLCTLSLTQCTLSGNSAASGGAIYNGSYSTLTLTQCTLSGNSAFSGGAIFNYGNLTLTNSIVAGNTATTGPDISHFSLGTITPTGKNLIGNLAGSNLTPGVNVIEASNPMLSPLGNYGGRTQTMLPLAGSPAIDAGDNAAIPSGVTTDQRGSVLPFNGTVDIGAVERGFVVTSATSSSSAGGLRYAVTNAGTGGMVINFDPSLDGQTILLTSNNSHFNLDKNLEINAGGLPDGITIDGGSPLKTRLFGVTGGKTVALHHLKLINGGDSGYNGFGGAILNEGNLTLTRCTLSGNEVASGNSGGAISSSLGSTLSLTDCTLSNNTADHGGAIVTVGTATLNRCTLNNNTARNGHGGAINGNASTVSLTQCTVTGNTATGTAANNGHGGGIFCLSSYLTMIHCTIAGNTANGFGGNGSGGGVFADGNSIGSFALANTIIAGNTALGTGPDFYESGNVNANVRFTGRVFIGDLGTPPSSGFSVTGNVLTGNAMLSPLGDYGGPTQTMVPLANSPVRDQAGSTGNVGTALNVSLPTDQRGTRRTLDSDNNGSVLTDLGATESGNGVLQDYYLWSQSVVFPGGVTAAQRGAAADYDNDGQSNYTEWLAQTSPNSGNSQFAVTQTTTSGQNVIISLPTSTGRIYRLRQQIGTSSSIYVPVAPIIGNDTFQSFTIPRSTSTGIYRVEVSLQ